MRTGRTRLTSVAPAVVSGALALSLASVPLVAGAVPQPRRRARQHVSATFPKGPWRVGNRVRIGVQVHPLGHRTVTLQRRAGGRWVGLTHGRTSAAGRAGLSWRARPAGSSRFRVLAAASGTQPAVASPVVRRTVVGDFLGVKAPARVAEGSVATVTYTVRGHEQALKHAVLTVTVPKQGVRVTPPTEPAIHDRHGVVTLGTVGKGHRKQVRLRWRMPTSRATLEFTGRLRATGVDQTRKVKIATAPPLAGSFHFDPDLRMSTEANGSPTRTTGGDFYADCTARLSTQPVTSFGSTLDAIDAATRPGTSTSAWKALRLDRKPQDADDVATIALSVGQPMAALAAAVAGYRGSQGVDETNYLNIAAAAANQAGHPGWAIALERKAATLPQDGIVGAKIAATRLTNLGHAYALMGDWSAARLWLDQAVADDGSSPQVAKEAFAVDYCAGDKKTALKEYHTSVRPDATKDEVDDNDGVPASITSPTYVNASRLMDISAGVQAGHFELPPVPQSITELDQHDKWTTLAKQALAQAQTIDKQMNALWQQLYDDQSLQPAERSRLIALMENYTGDGEDTLLAADHKELQTQGAIWTSNGQCGGQFQDNLYCNYTGWDTGCADNLAIFKIWKPQMQAYVDAIGNRLKVGWPIWTGVEANIGDSRARTYFDLARQSEYWWDLNSIYEMLSFSAHMEDQEADQYGLPNGVSCEPSPPPPSTTQPKAPDAAAAGCSPALSRLALSVDGEMEGGESDLPVGFSAKVSCQQLDFEVDLNALPFLSGFLDISTTPAGGVTLMVGSKGQVGIGPFQGSFSSAFYLTVGDGRKILDLGVDVGPDAEASAAGVHIQAYSDHIHMSAISVFADPNKYY